jgi:hypothetical protein
MNRRFAILLISIALWDCIDDQCVASLNIPEQQRMFCYSGDDDSFYPFAYLDRGQILQRIRWSRFTPAEFQPVAIAANGPFTDCLYLLMSLQL